MYGALKNRSNSFMGMGVKSILDAAMLAALADGEASDDEIWGAVEGLRELEGPFAELSDKDFEQLVEESFERVEGYGEPEDQVAEVARLLSKNEEHAYAGFAIAYAVLCMDDEFGEEEEEFLETFAEALGLDEETAEEIVAEVDAGFEEEDEDDEDDEEEDEDEEDEDEEDEDDEDDEDAAAPARLATKIVTSQPSKPSVKPSVKPSAKPSKPAESAAAPARPSLRDKKKDSSSGAGVAAVGAVAVGAVAVGAVAVASAGSKPKPARATPAAPAAPIEPAFSFSGSTAIDTALKEFGPDDYTVKLCNALFGVIPVDIQQASYGTLAQAADALASGAGNKARQKAEELANSEGVATGLKVVSAIDMGDTGIAAFSGLKSVFGLLTGQGTDALETDSQQGADAVLKLLALAYFIYSVYPGDLTDRVKMFYATPSGKALLAYYAAVEVGMPFADNALVAGGSFVGDLFSKYGPAATEKLGGLLPAGGVAAAQGMMGSLMAPIEGVVQKVAPHAKAAASAVSGFLPTAMNVLDKAGGAAATAIDAMPVYKYLGARVLAESCVLLGADKLQPVELPPGRTGPFDALLGGLHAFVRGSCAGGGCRGGGDRSGSGGCGQGARWIVREQARRDGACLDAALHRIDRGRSGAPRVWS